MGNSGGKKGRSGRRPKFAEGELLGLINKAWPKRQRVEAFAKLVERAGRGDLEALKLLLAYSYGKPRERHEITGKDGGAVQISIIEVVKPDGV